MAKIILEDNNGVQLNPITKASNVKFKDNSTLEQALSDKKEDMFTPAISLSETPMSKIGVGDSVDYHDNLVMDGIYESATLKGQTLVNVIQEPSSKEVVIPTPYTDIVSQSNYTWSGTREGDVKSANLMGDTLVNLTDIVKNTTTTLLPNIPVFALNDSFKPSTTYTIIFDCTKTNTLKQIFIQESLDTTFITGTAFTLNTGKNVVKLTTQSNKLNKITFRNPPTATDEITIGNIMIIEGDHTTKNIPYFTGMSSVQMPVLTTCGKNVCMPPKETLSQTNSGVTRTYNTNGDFTVKGTSTGSGGRTYFKDVIPKLSLKSGDVITFTVVSTGSQNVSSCLTGYNAGTMLVSLTGSGVRQVTITQDDDYYVGTNVNLGVTYDETIKYQIELSSVATTYEPYKTSILKALEPITLGRVGTVKDTFNALTGEVTLNTKELSTIDVNTVKYTESFGTYRAFRLDLDMRVGGSNKIECNKIPKKYGYGVNESATWTNGAELWINVPITELSGTSPSDFKKWYETNQVIVRYATEQSIVKTVGLSNLDQNGVERGHNFLPQFNGTTHLTVSSEATNSILPTVKHVDFTYPIILKPSTQYTVIHNHNANGSSTTLKLNLGGTIYDITDTSTKTLITTPATLLNEKLTFVGNGNKVNNVVVLEGNHLHNSCGYIEGLVDCKMPILQNTGKNLFDIKGNINQFIHSYAPHENVLNSDQTSFTVNSYSSSNLGRGQILNVKPYTTYKVYYGQTGSLRLMVTGEDLNRLVLKDIYGNAEVTMVTFNSGINNKVLLHFVTLGDSSATKATVKNIHVQDMVSEYNGFEEHKSNILSISGQGIELREDMYEQGVIGGYNGVTYDSDKIARTSSLRLIKPVEVEPNTVYNFSVKSGYEMWVKFYDEDLIGLAGNLGGYQENYTVTSDSNAKYISTVIRKKEATTILPSEINNANPSVYEVDKTMVLRSLPNGVCDTLNLLTGEYVQRIGEVVLNGSEEWVRPNYNNNYNNTTFFDTTLSGTTNNDTNLATRNNVLADVPSYILYAQDNITGVGNPEGRIRVKVYRSWLTADTAETFKLWLQENPITVQYELVTPITRTVDVQGLPLAYKDGHLILESGYNGQSVPPKIEYTLPTNRNGVVETQTKNIISHDKEISHLESLIMGYIK